MDRQSVVLLLLVVLGIFSANWRTFPFFLFSFFFLSVLLIPFRIQDSIQLNSIIQDSNSFNFSMSILKVLISVPSLFLPNL